MSTHQKQIRDAVKALLVTATGMQMATSTPTPGCIYPSARRDIPDELLPAILVYSHADKPVDPDEDHSKSHQRIYTLRVEARVADRPEEDATDALCIAIRKAVLQDDTQAQLIIRTTWDLQQWDGVEQVVPVSGSALDFNFHYFWSPEW